MADNLADDSRKPPSKPFRVTYFRATCPLCPYIATATRYGMEQEHLAAHLLAIHTPVPTTDAVS